MLLPILVGSLLLRGDLATAAGATFPAHLVGSVSAVAQLIERQLPGSSGQFHLAIAPTCPNVPRGKACFAISDSLDGKGIRVTGTTASELTAGVGFYLRERCGLTIGWPRGGGSRLDPPDHWPRVGEPVSRTRSVPYSHVTQVCTHSYTLVWYDWEAWETFIDWMALAGHNSIVAPTGQEEVQYKVLTSPAFGLTDMQVRNWTNGPGFLTWSRGQNSHGNGIAGPLPRSFMRSQWELQKLIMARYRSLGIVGHLPAFGGFAPWALAVAHNDSKPHSGATRGKIGKDWDTAWIDGRDPLFTQVADAWMEQIMADFGSDHAWQMDAFFANGTSWGEVERSTTTTTGKASRVLPPDPVFLARAKAAYGAIERADGPSARWFYQSWAIQERDGGMSPATEGLEKALSRLHGFSSAAPEGNFIVLDMSQNAGRSALSPDGSGRTGGGMWRDPWNGSWGLPFVWTALPEYGGNQGIKGNLSEINTIPFDAPPFAAAPSNYNSKTQVVGVGYTPEGLDQNPAYYELIQEAAFKTEPEPNITAWLIKRANRRYGIANNADVASAWSNIGASGYSNDAVVHDTTAVGTLFPTSGHIHTPAWMGFIEPGRTTPTASLCREWNAWGALLEAAPAVPKPLPTTYTYDLVDIGREVLSQLTIPIALNFTSAINTNSSLDEAYIKATGGLYVELLYDLDKLLATDRGGAFLLGRWLAAARKLGGNATDCGDTVLGDRMFRCDDFMEWNARAQITTWHPVDSPTNPTPVPEGASWPGAINDYARKQWQGLVGGYYAPRVQQYLEQAIADAQAGQPFNTSAVIRRQAKLAFEWQTDFGNIGSTNPIGDPIAVATRLRNKYASFFAPCA